jgi:hypothetical protein
MPGAARCGPGAGSVKTGAVADPSSRGTRRQILEYAQVYGVPEVYLFDADAQQLHHIGIPQTVSARTRSDWSAWSVAAVFAVGTALGALVAWWVVRG